jgi:hypothetical protein
MPFQSEKQRRYLWANEPEIARDWTDTYGSRIEKNDGGIMRVGLRRGGPQDWGAEAEAKQKGSANVSKDNPYSDAARKETRDLNRRVEASTTLRRLEADKKEAKVEKFRHKNINNPLNKAMNYVPYIGMLKRMFPQGTRSFFLDNVLTAGHYGGITEDQFYAMSPEEQEKALKEYSRARGMGEIDAYGRTIESPRSGAPIYPYPLDVHPGTRVTEVDEVVEEVPSNFQPVSMAQLPYPNYPLLADGGRIGRAYGGIMDSSTGRRAYGFGSIFSKIGRAAKKVLKSPIAKIGIGALALGMPWTAGKPALTNRWFGENTGWGKIAPYLFKGGKDDKWGEGDWNPWKIGIGAAAALPFFMGGEEEEDDEPKFDYDAAKNAYANELMRIKAGAMAGTLDPTKFRYLGVKDGGRIGLQEGGDPILREEYDKYVFEMEEMNLIPMTFEEFKAQARAGMYAGGQSIPSEYTMEDAMMTTTQDKLGGITDVMKQADLNRKGTVGQFYAAQGGRIGYDAGGQTGHPPITMGQVPQVPPQMPAPQMPHSPMPAPQPNRMAGMNPMMNRPMMNPMMNRPMMNPMMGGRRMAQEGGLMDLGGMEKDYRNDGGFVPLGGEEKADDVPARLSKNEFVFTADAVRGAGDGDIDKGAEIMENVMKNLEQGGQVSEETQGLAGAQEMFGVSERLSEVV